MDSNVDRIILETRMELAGRYGWVGRHAEAALELFPHLEPSFARRGAARMLAVWDDYNAMCEYVRAARAQGVRGSMRELIDAYEASKVAS